MFNRCKEEPTPKPTVTEVCWTEGKYRVISVKDRGFIFQRKCPTLGWEGYDTKDNYFWSTSETQLKYCLLPTLSEALEARTILDAKEAQKKEDDELRVFIRGELNE